MKVESWKCDICEKELLNVPFRGITKTIPTVNKPIVFNLSVYNGDFCEDEILKYLPEFIKKLEWLMKKYPKTFS